MAARVRSQPQWGPQQVGFALDWVALWGKKRGQHACGKLRVARGPETFTDLEGIYADI